MQFIGKHQVPDPLTSINGENIDTITKWEQIRRPEILNLFTEHIYGSPSVQRPKTLVFNVVDVNEKMMDGKAIRKQIEISYDGPGGKSGFQLLLFIPNYIHKPVSTFLFLNNREYETMDPDRKIKSSFWPAEYIIERGYATAVFQVSEVAPDDAKDPYTKSVHTVFDKDLENRPPNAWGTIAAWSWGASRAMDYLETDPHIDEHQVAVIGHSRGGKAALWAGATDERFALIISNNSGCTGAAIARGKTGETIENINTKFPHWFNKNYKYYNGKETELPIDQHMLITLLAPRRVYVASASKDDWADPKAEFMSLVYAESVYRLFGYKGLQTNQFPNVNSLIHGDRLGYHLREGIHDLTEYDWKNFMNYWEFTKKR